MKPGPIPVSSRALARRRHVTPGPSGIITLLTDFGLEDPYVGVMKGVLLGINPGARLVDLTHAIPPQDILRGALALQGAYAWFPRGTIHLAVVDPGVGGARRPLAVGVGGHYFVGPDNGLLGFLFEAPGAGAVTLTNAAYHRRGVSRTFHARDVFAPVAAYCSLGVPLARFGPAVRDPVRLPWPQARRAGRRVVGQVLLADRFGNLLTNVAAADVPVDRQRCEVEIGGCRMDGVVGAYSERPAGTLGALIDSSGRLEIFVRDGSARERLGLGPGAPVSLWSRSSSTSRRTTRGLSRTTSRGLRRPSPKAPRASRSRRSRPAPSSSPTPSLSSVTRTGSPSRTSLSPSG